MSRGRCCWHRHSPAGVQPLQLVPVAAHGHRGLPAQLIGFVVSAYFAGFLFGSLWASAVVSQVGHMRAFAAFAAILTGSFLFLALFVSPLGVDGDPRPSRSPSPASWASHRKLAERPRRQRQPRPHPVLLHDRQPDGVGPRPAVAGRRPPAATCPDRGGAAVGGTRPVALSPSAGPPPPSRNALNLLALYRISPLGVVGCFTAVGLSNAAFYSLAPLFGAVARACR